MHLPSTARRTGLIVAALGTLSLLSTAAVALPATAVSTAHVALALWIPVSTAPLADAVETDRVARLSFRASSARLAARDTIVTVSNSRAAGGEARSAHVAVLERTLRDAGREWYGVPYRFGGQTRNGIDCSAFVRTVMRDYMGVDLPRNTTAQVTMGQPVNRGELRVGDLVFFSRRGTRHVGIYTGRGEFLHASTSRGVMVSSMSEGYWNNQYWTARRVIPEPTSARPTPRAQRSATTAAAPDSSRRALW